VNRLRSVPTNYASVIAARYGTAGLMAFEQRYRELLAQGVTAGVARRQALDYLHTCPRCGGVVSVGKGGANRRQHSSGRLEHVTSCAG
jgi:triphosphoribosyl-dephospho-CoA synthetase